MRDVSGGTDIARPLRANQELTPIMPSLPRLPLIGLIAAAALAVGACASGTQPSWTYAPSPTPAAPAPAASGAPASSGAPAASGGAATSGAPAATDVPGGGAAAATLALTASGVQYDKTELEAPADKAFAIAFTNNDAGIPHNVAIHKDSPTGAEVWKGEIFAGVAEKTYQVPALPAGTYGFVCTVHPNMTGTLTVK
jgi:plastocyanin